MKEFYTEKLLPNIMETQIPCYLAHKIFIRLGQTDFLFGLLSLLNFLENFYAFLPLSNCQY